MTSNNDIPIAILEVVPASRVERTSYAGETEATIAHDTLDPDATISYGRPRSIPVTEFPFRIGRGAGNNVLIQDNGMSRNSVAIAHANGQLELEDLGQKQGVRVNGTQISGRHVLEFDDVITFPNADVKITPKKPVEAGTQKQAESATR